jgi:hypothetical protein
MRSTGYLIAGLLFLGMATIHAVLLFTGATGPSDLFPE